MSNFLTQLTLPKKHDPQAFIAYMKQDFLGEVRKVPRIGTITGATLLVGNWTSNSHQYLLLTEWDGNAHSPFEFLESEIFTDFKAKIKELGAFESAAILAPNT